MMQPAGSGKWDIHRLGGGAWTVWSYTRAMSVLNVPLRSRRIASDPSRNLIPLADLLPFRISSLALPLVPSSRPALTMATDLYETLGLDKNASPEDSAYPMWPIHGDVKADCSRYPSQESIL